MQSTLASGFLVPATSYVIQSLNSCFLYGTTEGEGGYAAAVALGGLFLVLSTLRFSQARKHRRFPSPVLAEIEAIEFFLFFFSLCTLFGFAGAFFSLPNVFFLFGWWAMIPCTMFFYLVSVTTPSHVRANRKGGANYQNHLKDLRYQNSSGVLCFDCFNCTIFAVLLGLMVWLFTVTPGNPDFSIRLPENCTAS